MNCPFKVTILKIFMKSNPVVDAIYDHQKQFNVFTFCHFTLYMVVFVVGGRVRHSCLPMHEGLTEKDASLLLIVVLSH